MGADFTAKLLDLGPYGLVVFALLSALVFYVRKEQGTADKLLEKTEQVARLTAVMTEALNDANAKRDEMHGAHLKLTGAVEELTKALDRLTTRLNERADDNKQLLNKILDVLGQMRIAGVPDARSVRE